MYKYSNLKKNQLEAINNTFKKLNYGLFLPMGFGKTVVALTAAKEILDDFYCDRVLIISPLKVANTNWESQAKQWEHLKDLKFSICTGSAQERTRAVKREAEIYVINVENVKWLVERFDWKWDLIIVDESTCFKNHASKRFKFLKSVLDKIKSVFILTGTPAPNGYIDLWSQIYLLDRGKRLGRNISSYRSRFFEQSYDGFSWSLRPGAKEEIDNLISDICISGISKDLENLEQVDIYRKIPLEGDIKSQYKELEKDFIIKLSSETEITAFNQASISNKLLQFCNGAVYDEDRKFHKVHDLKIKALHEILKENPNKNLFVAYSFISDMERLKKEFPDAVVLDRKGERLNDWNEGKIKILLAHPKSAGHGLNAQFGGSIVVWFGLTWSLENYQQFNARLVRSGQKDKVKIYHIMIKDSVEETILQRLKDKSSIQKKLLDYLKDFYNC